MGTAPQCPPHTAAETSLLQIKTNFESNLNLALKNYNGTADHHSEAVDTIQRTVSAPLCLVGSWRVGASRCICVAPGCSWLGVPLHRCIRCPLAQQDGRRSPRSPPAAALQEGQAATHGKHLVQVTADEEGLWNYVWSTGSLCWHI